jgi:drug/metabolite transporter (DMT)-like permease
LKRYKAELLLFLVATLWAGTFPIVKTSVVTFPPFYFVGIRFLIGALLFTLIFFNKLKLQEPAVIKAGLILGLLQTIGFASQTIGMLYTTASNSALITGITILIVPFAQYIITRKPVHFENWIGIAIVITGLFFLTQPHISGINKGDFITMICAFAWAFYIIYIDVYTNKHDITTLIFIQLWMTAVICSGIGAFAEDFGAITFSGGEILSLLYMGILATLVTTVLLNRYQKETSPIRASIIYTWEQPAAVALSILFINEHFNSLQIVGGTLMVVGILFSETFGYMKTRAASKAEQQTEL